MIRRACRWAGAGLVALLILGSADAGSPAPPSYDPHSTDAAPCGSGTPPPGRFAVDLRPTPTGVTLTVKQDGSRLCYVANGIAEAPVLRVRQGDDLAITLQNDITDPAAIDAVTAADTLKTPNPEVPRTAEFYPVIPGMRHPATGATNLHVHGFAVPPVAPQDEVLNTCTDPAVGLARCGHRAFAYRYHVPVAMPEGLYWYHPHMHGQVQAQMLMGLSGAIVVEGPEEDARRAAGIAERVLIVRQTQDSDAAKPATVASSAMTAAPPAPSVPQSAVSSAKANAIDTAHELLCNDASEIDEISLNGTPVPIADAPDAALAHLEIPAGTHEFWRVRNAANDAFLDLVLVDENGKRLPLEIFAQDGAPLTDDAGRRRKSRPTTDPQFMPPSGRLEFLVAAPPSGIKAFLVTRAVDTGCAGDQLPERKLAVVTASSPPATAQTPLALPAAEPDFFSGLMSRKIDHRRVIALAEYPRAGTDDQTDFYIAERQPGAVLKPYEMGGEPAITVKAGTTEEWTVENWTNELHAFHIHQLHFRLLEIDGKPVAEPPLLDVVNVPFATATGFHSKEGPVRPGRVRVKLSFPEALAGDIPFHCHLADHEDNGMMAVLRVLPANSSKPEKRAALSPDELLSRPPICRAGKV